MEANKTVLEESTMEKLHQLIESLPKRPDQAERVMSVKEVATSYFDGITPQSASRALRKETREHPVLSEALALTGWSQNKRYFTPLQVRLLEAYLT